jgi:hypothetical protein
VCSADNFFYTKEGDYLFDPAKLSKAHGKCLTDFVYLVSKKPHGDQVPVVVDNTNTTVTEIAPYAALALAYGCDLEIVLIQCEPGMAHSRNTHGVPLKSVMGQHDRLVKLAQPGALPPWWPVKKVNAEF